MRLKFSKASSPLAMATTIVLVAVAMVIGVWIVSALQQSVTLPTYATSESLTLVNATARAVSLPYINTISSISNATVTLGAGNYTFTDSTVTATFVCAPGNCLAGAWNVAYTYNPSGANNTMLSVISTTWSSFQLGVVVLIVIAAVAIIGLLVTGFGRSAGE